LSTGPSGIPKRDLVQEIFLSSDEPRLRAGWRLLIQTTLMVIVWICMSVPLGFYLALSSNFNLNVDSLGGEILLPLQIAELVIFTVSIYIARRFLDKRTFQSLGLALNRKALWDLCAGILITFVMLGLIFWIEMAAGWLKVEAFAWQVEPLSSTLAGTGIFLLIFALTGWNEELLSRGYHLQTIASGLNRFWGVLLSSLVFGLLHQGNPNASWISTFGIFIAGLFFAFGYLRTGGLWLPIGMHLGWNFFEGVAFGFPVSGLDIYRLIRHQVTGPDLWTGGSFGPEAGLVMIPALILGTILIYLYTKTAITSQPKEE
jgi:membrane protease YdiL (CAAX protease family)